MNDFDTFLKFDTFYKEHMSLEPNALSLSEAESNVLLLLNQYDTLNARKIEEYLKVDRGYLSRILNRLTNKKYIERIQDRKDKRIFHIKLTDSGRTKLEALEEEFLLFIKKKYSSMSDKTLNDITRNLEDVMNLYFGHGNKRKEQNKHSSKDELIVLPGTTGDMGYVLSAHSDFFQVKHGFNSQFISRILEEISEYNKGRFRAKFFILWEGIERVGSIIVLVDSYNNAQFGWFVVNQNTRSNEYRDLLLQAAFQFCEEEKINHVFTTSLIDDPDLKEILERYGFQNTSEQFSKKWNDSGTVITRYELHLKNEQN